MITCKVSKMMIFSIRPNPTTTTIKRQSSLAEKKTQKKGPGFWQGLDARERVTSE